MTIHEKIEELAELGKTYAQDGAFRSAARVFSDLSHIVKAHAKACDENFKPSRHIDNGPDSRGERKSR